MKYFFTAVFILLTVNVFAQDTVYYADSETAITNRELASHYKIVEFKGNNKDTAVKRCYFMSGKMESEENYSLYSDSKKILHGKTSVWNENGQKILEENYKEGKRDGQLLTYWSNGQLKRNETYENGESIKGNCYTREGKDTTYYDYEVMPQFPGGVEALLKFIANNINYPNKAKRKGITGKVYTTFVVDKEGNVKDVKIIRGVSPEIDEESLRVVKLIPKWKPGFMDGEPVRVQYNLPIKFTLK